MYNKLNIIFNVSYLRANQTNKITNKQWKELIECKIVQSRSGTKLISWDSPKGTLSIRLKDCKMELCIHVTLVSYLVFDLPVNVYPVSIFHVFDNLSPEPIWFGSGMRSSKNKLGQSSLGPESIWQIFNKKIEQRFVEMASDCILC